MRIFIVHIGDISLYPPVLSLINTLDELRIKTTVITTSLKGENGNYNYVEFETLGIDYERPKNAFFQFVEMLKIKKMLWKILDSKYSEDDIIWSTYNVTLKHLGKKILNKNYVVQLMELMDSLTYHPRLPFLKMNATKICNRALAVVVPEYNRAHIQKAYWNLTHLPLILQNKPFLKMTVHKKDEIVDSHAANIIQMISEKKIILYQGGLNEERPLDKFIRAVDKLGDEYAFVVMSNSDNIYKNIDSRNYYFIPYVKAPNHLQITSHAYIGVLSYVPTRSKMFSPLNALYCAPNKIFEYSMFAIPMIGNDIPGLKYILDNTHSGITIKDLNEENIVQAILSIDKQYEKFSCAAERLYTETDYANQLQQILNVCQERKNEG